VRELFVHHPAGEERVREGVEPEVIRDRETRATEPRQTGVLFVETELVCLLLTHSASANATIARLARYPPGVRALGGVAVLAGFLAVSAALAAPPSISVVPATVHRGHTVVVKGSADGCTVGNTVTLISRAFVHTHDFAGLPAVFAKVKYGGKFKVTTKIPATKTPKTYTITARCGGGNLGVTAHLKVIA
jgi:hypothetical protein